MFVLVVMLLLIVVGEFSFLLVPEELVLMCMAAFEADHSRMADVDRVAKNAGSRRGHPFVRAYKDSLIPFESAVKCRVEDGMVGTRGPLETCGRVRAEGCRILLDVELTRLMFRLIRCRCFGRLRWLI